MSRRDARVRLQHMLDAAREAVSLTAGKTREGLGSERVLQLALVRLLEILGEAASALPAEDRSAAPGIPWQQIVGMRNRLIHGYESVDLDVVWQTIKLDLPPLVAALERALRSAPPA